MIKTLCITLVSILTAIGFFAIIYALIMLYIKAKNSECYCFTVKLTGNFKDDTRQIMYAVERSGLFGDGENCNIMVIDYGKNPKESEKIKEFFSLCPRVTVIKDKEINDFLKFNL